MFDPEVSLREGRRSLVSDVSKPDESLLPRTTVIPEEQHGTLHDPRQRTQISYLRLGSSRRVYERSFLGPGTPADGRIP